MVCRTSLPRDLPAGWQTYSSPDYGFTIDYLATMSLYPSHLDHNCDITSVACFGYNGREDVGAQGTNFGNAGVSVNVLRDRRREQECYNIHLALHPLRTETIKGTNFRYAITATGWTSHYESGPTYRAFHQNVCFEIAVGVTTVSTGALDPGAIKEFDPAKLDRLLDQMVHTFKFVGPVKDGPGWKLYSDAMCGAVFEYPEGDTILTAVEYSKDRFDSDEITCSRYFTDHGLKYTIAQKANLKGKSAFETWLKSSGYPDLSKAIVAATSKYYTEYEAAPYYYVFGREKFTS